MQALPGAGPYAHDGVVTEHLGVAVGRAGLGLAIDLAYGRVDIDYQPGRPRPRPQGPRPAQALGDDGVQLSDVAETERPQEVPQGGRGHDPVPEHAGRRPCPQPVGVADVAGPGTVSETNGGAYQGLQAQTGHQRRHQDQPGVGLQARLVEGHLNPVKVARYWPH